MSTSRSCKELLVKIWGYRGPYTERVLLAPGYRGGDFVIDKVHKSKVDEWNSTACAWMILGIIEGEDASSMRVLPVVNGWVYSVQGDKLRPVEAVA